MIIPEIEPSHTPSPSERSTAEPLNVENSTQTPPTETQLKMQLQQAILLGEVTNEIRQSLDTTTIFQVAVDKVQTLLQVDRVAIFQFDPATDYKQGVFVAEKVIPVYYSAVAARVQDESFAENYATKYQLGRVFAVADIYDAGLSDCHIQIYERFQVRATLVVPLLQGQKLWGLLCIHQCSGPRAWKSTEINFIKKLADQLSVALKQAELHEQAIVKSQQLHYALNQVEAQKEREAWLAQYERNITQIIQHIHQSLDIEDIFKATTQDIRQFLSCDRVAVYTFTSAHTSQLHLESFDVNLPPLANIHQPNLWQEIYLQDKETHANQETYIVLVTDIYQQHHTDGQVAQLKQLQIQAYMLVPVFIGDTLWGLLVICQQSQRLWDNIELSLVQRVGDQLGVALQQAELMNQLQISKDKAEAANRAKSAFLANMSHELRTPLNAILGFSQLLNRDANLTPKQKQTLTSINRSGSHLLNLINDVLEMSKIEAGRVSLNFKNCDLMSLLDSIQEMFLLKVKSKGLTLVVDKAPDLPLYIRTDESRLRQVVINILTNALKFTQQGSVALKVFTKPLLSEDFKLTDGTGHPVADEYQPNICLCIDVEDTGVGISEAEMGNLFETFTQASAGRNATEGAGLGLAICRHCVELMGGEILINSQEGQGTIVQIQVPVMATPNQSVDHLDTPMVLKLAPDQPHYRMLVVEDNPENAQIVIDLMTSVGFDVQSVNNGQQAVVCWQAWQPHVILMDWQMPIMNGYEATQAIRRFEHQDLKTRQSQPLATAASSSDPTIDQTIIIALTASVFEDTKQECYEAGCDDFLCKPYQQSVLFEILAIHLNLQYLYEGGPQDSHALNTASSHGMNQREVEYQLSQLSEQWLECLHQAAIELDEDQMSQQFIKIASDHPYLATHLTKLFQSLQFDQLASLVQAAIEFKRLSFSSGQSSKQVP